MLVDSGSSNFWLSWLSDHLLRIYSNLIRTKGRRINLIVQVRLLILVGLSAVYFFESHVIGCPIRVVVIHHLYVLAGSAF